MSEDLKKDPKNVWEFAVSPKQAAIIGACLVFSSVCLAGAGVVAGLLLAPRRYEVQARSAAARQTASLLPSPRKAAESVATPPPATPVPEIPKKPEATEASGLQSPQLTQKEIAVAPSKQIGTGLESAVLAPAASSVPASPSTPVTALANALAPVPVVAGAPAAADAKPAPLPIRMTIRVGSFSIEENARNFVEHLKRFGYPAVDFPNTDAHGQQWHVVQVGPYAAYDDASKTALELSSKYRLEPLIIPLTSF